MMRLLLLSLFIPALSSSQVVMMKEAVFYYYDPSIYSLQVKCNETADSIVAASLVPNKEHSSGLSFWHVITPCGQRAYITDFGPVVSEEVRKKYKALGTQGDPERIVEAGKVYRERLEAKQKKQQQEDRVSDSLTKKFIKDYEKYGIVVSDWSWYYPNEYSSAVDVEVEILNLSKKKIKYVWFTLAAYNPVDDRLTSMGKSSVTIRGIGPIEGQSVGEWSWDHVFWSEVIATMKITQVKVQYFDGTVKVLPGNSPAIFND